MKRALILSFCFLVSVLAPHAEASPAVCEGEYSGSYSGDFSGSATADFYPDLCGAGSSRIIAMFHGELGLFAFGVDPTGFDVCLTNNLSFDLNGAIDFSGTFDANTCTITGTYSYQVIEIYTGQFTLRLGSPEVLWTATNGDFNEPSNWNPQEVPDTSEIGVFNQTLTYAVSFGSPASSKGFRIEGGDVTFLTGSYQATGGSETAPSAIVANDVNSAILRLASHNLTTAFSTIALTPGSPGEVSVEDGSTWTEQARMVVGKGGLAFLNLNDNALVTSLETQVGADPLGDGTVNVSEDVPFNVQDPEWITGSLGVGVRGVGTVNHYDGDVRSERAVLGVESGSMGMVKVGSSNNSATWFLNGPLTIGDRGKGLLEVVDGGYVFVNAITQLVIGASLGGMGEVRIEGASTEIFAPGCFLIVGANGSGKLSLASGSEASCEFGIVGADGEANINASKWECTDFLTIGNSGRVILNNGGIVEARNSLDLHSGGSLEGSGIIDTDQANLNGTVSPGVFELPKGAPSQGNGIGTLTFDGNVNFGTGTIQIDVGGLEAGAYDVIHATGEVDIQNATVHFSFIDGFLPRTGNMVPFLMADGGLAVANLVLEFEGVEEGFLFDLAEENGMLMFHALNDALPILVDPIPLPTALNPNADVNGDNLIDASDLLEVMENWYHLVPE